MGAKRFGLLFVTIVCGRLKAQEVTYELLESSRLYESRCDGDGSDEVESALTGTFVLSTRQQGPQVHVYEIEDVDFRSDEDEDLRISGGGQYVVGFKPIFEKTLVSVVFEVDIRGSGVMSLTTEFGWYDRFPRFGAVVWGGLRNTCYDLFVTAYPRENKILSFFRRGDVNGDSFLDISDVVSVLHFLFLGDNVSCMDSADANDDGLVDVSDAVYSLHHLFLGGRPPVPLKICGLDLTEDALDCNGQPACMGDG